jgi:hypothetical protein
MSSLVEDYSSDDGEDEEYEIPEINVVDAYLKQVHNMSYTEYCMNCDSQIMELPVDWSPPGNK